MAVIIDITIHTRAPRQTVVEAIHAAVRSLSTPSRSRKAASLMVRTGLQVLKTVKDSFELKSRGGTDAAGLRWAPLAPATIASRRKRGDRRRNPLILQDTRAMARTLRPGARPDRAPSSPPKVDNQVFTIGPGLITVGSEDEKAPLHHEGRPPKLPQRRLWAKVSHWPAPWWDGILDQVVKGLVELIKEHIP